MPLFIHYDDAEYGIRNIKNGLLFINGICVWHPSPVNKDPFWMIYYNVRNRLITMFSKRIDRADFDKFIINITKKFILKIIRYEYSDARMMLDGLQDFLRGPNTFVTLDAVLLHEKLIENKELLFTPEDVGVSLDRIIKKRHPNLKKAVIIQVFCNLLPARKKICSINLEYYNIPYFADKVYLYNEKTGKGTINKRNQKEFFRLLFLFLALRRKLKKNFNRMLHDWQAAKPTLTSLSFWEKYLGLKKD